MARYAGIDDHLLAAMVDPARRSTVSFVVSLREEARRELLDGEWLTREWGELAAEQQAALQSCLRRMRWGRGGGRGAGTASPGEQDWGGAALSQVYVGGLDYGWVMLTGELEAAEGEPERRRGRFVTSPRLNLMGEGELAPDERIALRGAAGESVTEEERESLADEWSESRRDEMRERWRERTREEVEARLAEQRPLSRDVEEILSSFTLPAGTPHALWQVQEAVASASGMHLVSDCFSQPRRSLGRSREALYGEEEPEMTGLLALRLSCLSTEGPWGLAWGVEGDDRAGWEWHDAGTFLRFRSEGRDLWRASMLPLKVSKRLDEWLDPYVEEAIQREGSALAVDVELDAEEMGLLAASLSDIQIRHGGKLVCGNPKEREAACRQALRAGVLRAVSRSADMLRVLATFSGSQWEQLRGRGLRLEYDLTPGQRDLLGLSEQPAEGGSAEAMARRPGRSAPRPGRGMRGRPGGGGARLRGGEAPGMVMRLSEEPPPGTRFGRGRGRRGGGEGTPDRDRRGRPRGRGRWATESHYLGFWSGDEARGLRFIPRVVTVEVTLPEPIAEQEEAPDA
jgi:hypothetical protein